MVHPDTQRHTLDPVLGQRLRLERLRQWRSLDDLAAAAGISRRMLCYLQTGDRAPSLTVAYRLLAVLGVDTATGWGAEFMAAAIPDVGKDRY